MSSNQNSNRDIAKLWALRALVNLNGYRGLNGYPDDMTPNDDVMNLVGLGHLNYEALNARGFVRQLKELHADEELLDPEVTGNLKNNLEALGEMIGLSEVEQQVLGFSLVLQNCEPLEEAVIAIGKLNTNATIDAVSTILKLRKSQVRKALEENSLLSLSGLLRIQTGYPDYLKDKLELLDDLADRMFDQRISVEQLLSNYFCLASAGALSVKDYPHITNQAQLLKEYFSKAAKLGFKGVNCLLYGPPGTGKSELARSLAAEAGLTLYEIAITASNGDPVHRSVRLKSYALSQHILARQADTLILFDEIEEIFEPERVGLFSPVSFQKAWFNRLLEQNPVPAIWITNDVESMDPAHIRRFDVVVELGIPPKTVRNKILKSHLLNLSVSGEWLERIAENAELSPAVVATAAKVTARLEESSAEQNQHHMEMLLNEALGALGHQTGIKRTTESLIPYSIDFLNPDVDLNQLVTGLKRHQSARICLHGPSGTGKTAFGRHLAQALDLPIHVKRASDILSPYVGETEQAIARMFREADQEDAVLMIDEADSFFRDRQNAHRGWEVTQVNELLTQMEEFDGIFVCSTNLLDVFDPASLRRFDFKIKLDYLKPDQIVMLFSKVIEERSALEPMISARLARLTELTLGDFAAVLRRMRIQGSAVSENALLVELEREAVLKQQHRNRGIGFFAPI